MYKEQGFLVQRLLPHVQKKKLSFLHHQPSDNIMWLSSNKANTIFRFFLNYRDIFYFFSLN